MEKFAEYFHTAFSNLRLNAIRSFLSILGIVIGIASVITILSLGAGARQEILKRMSTMGANLYFLYGHYDSKTLRSGQLEINDIARLQNLPFVITAYPTLNLYKEVRSRRNNLRGIIRGVNSTYLNAREFTVVSGRNFSPVEDEQRAGLCLINENAAKQLFNNENILGSDIYFDGVPWRVIGVYGNAVKNSRREFIRDDIEIMVPMTTLMRNAKDLYIQSIEVQVKPDYDGDVAAELTAVMERNDPKMAGLFKVRDQKELIEKSLEVRRTLSLIGACVAGISLIVGGIGMMNVMLTSVSERTREIGVRRAVGARKKDILYQFLVESCFLSGCGGFLGLVLGAAIARGLPVVFPTVFTMTASIQPGFLFIAAGSGVTLGVTFGLYPAIKASKLSPAEALRTE